MADSDLMHAKTIKILSWAEKKKIRISEINAIVDIGFTSMDTLTVPTLEDIKKAKLPIGQQSLLTLDETFREEATRLAVSGTGEMNETVNADTVTDNREIHGDTETQPGLSGHPAYEEAAFGNLFVQSLIGQFRNGTHGVNNAVPIAISDHPGPSLQGARINMLGMQDTIIRTLMVQIKGNNTRRYRSN